MANYAAKAKKAKATLARKGQTAHILRTTRTGGGPSDPTGGTTTIARHEVKLVVFPMDFDRIDGTNIFSGDYRVLCSTADVEIKLSDKIECSAGVLTIKDLGEFAPDGTIIFYDMVARN